MATVPPKISRFPSNMSLLFGDRTEMSDESPGLNPTRYNPGPAVGHTGDINVSLNERLSQIHAAHSSQPATQYSPVAVLALFPEGYLHTIEE